MMCAGFETNARKDTTPLKGKEWNSLLLIPDSKKRRHS
jgi:hypothetical protein